MPSPNEKRHLPLVGNPEPENIPPQSPWVWVLLGSIVVVSLWVPLALVALLLSSKIAAYFAISSGSVGLKSHSLALVVPTTTLAFVSFASACAVGGAVVGRFAERPRRYDAALAGTLGCLIIVFLAALGNALQPPLAGAAIVFCMLSVAVPTAALGGRWGHKRRVQ